MKKKAIAAPQLTNIRVRLTGVAPLLLHSARLCDPSDEITRAMKAITSKPAKGKNAKTPDDLVELQRLEFLGGLYWSDDLGPYIPSSNIEGLIRDGAKSVRMGSATEAGLQAEDAPLLYDGPRDPDELWSSGRFHDVRSTVVGRARVMRTRPVFRSWAIETTVTLFGLGIQAESIPTWLAHAGTYVGLGDYRPKFGRFVVEVI